MNSLMDIGLNGNTPDQFRAAFDNSGLRLLDIAYNRGDKRCCRCSRRLARVSPLDRFTTASIYAVFGV